jgi:restriction system protein
LSGKNIGVAALLAVLSCAPCWGRDALHARSTVYGCSDPRAARIANDAEPDQHGAARMASIRRSGHCFPATPDQLWEPIVLRDGLLLARLSPPSPGEPPLFFRPGDLVTATAASPRIAHAVAWAVPLGAMLVLRHLFRGRRALALARAEIEAHQARLRVRRLQLLAPDQYGTRDAGRWSREKAYFCRTRILRALTAQGLARQWPGIAGKVDRRIERAASRPAATWRGDRISPRGGDPGFHPGMDPIDYERHCALLLRRAGWTAQLTAASGDQGTDVLARRGRRSLVLQCKLYGRPVGNSAVQQIAAARAHHRADFAAVVSNADFTRHARELAASNGVYLLHHEELRDFLPLC